MKLSSYDFIGQNIKDGWKWSWFQASRIDRPPYPIQRWVAKLLIHKHQLEYPRSNTCASDRAHADMASEAATADSEKATMSMGTPREALAKDVVLAHAATTLQYRSYTFCLYFRNIHLVIKIFQQRHRIWLRLQELLDLADITAEVPGK
ncbi:unnamed protein product [Cylicostephanus goldi]|uniref:Uncharacterized protein n=1 Tax=Cylicostephanus goldi TaxID=71465 RepID=A0A3P7MAP8_CYLGO|nr:unnamed protein product [Cylicostephanus goldi]